MKRNGVGAKRIKNHQVVARVSFPGQRKTRVTQNHAKASLAIIQEGKKTRIAGNALDGGVDLEERPVLVRLRIGDEGAGPQAHHGNLVLGVCTRERFEYLADGGRISNLMNESIRDEDRSGPQRSANRTYHMGSSK